MKERLKNLLATTVGRVIALLLVVALIAVGQCVIPGATTVVVTSGWSPLAADTGKIYWANCSSPCTVTLPATPPTAVWRFKLRVVGSVVTVNPSGLQIDQVAANKQFITGTSVDISTDGTNYYSSGRTGIPSVLVCNIPVGDTSASALTNAQLGPQIKICQIPAPSLGATVSEIDVSADGGTPNVIVGARHCTASPCVPGANETVSNLTSSALATASSGGTACSKSSAASGVDTFTTCSGTLQNTSLSQGDYIELVSGTAGGTAKLMTIHVFYTLN